MGHLCQCLDNLERGGDMFMRGGERVYVRKRG